MMIATPGEFEEHRISLMASAANDCMDLISVKYGLTLDEALTAIASIIDMYCHLIAESKESNLITAQDLKRTVIQMLFYKISALSGQPAWILMERKKPQSV